MARFQLFSYVADQVSSAKDYFTHKQEALEKEQELCILDTLFFSRAEDGESMSVEKVYKQVSFREIFSDKKELERTTFRLAAKNLIKLQSAKKDTWNMSITSEGVDFIEASTHFSFTKTAGEWASNFGQIKFAASILLTAICVSLIFGFDAKISDNLKHIPLFSSVVDVSLVEQMEKINEDEPVYKAVKKAISSQISWKNILKMEPIKNNMLSKKERAFLLTQTDGQKLLARVSQEDKDGTLSVFALSEKTGVLKPLFNFPIATNTSDDTQKFTY